MQPTNSIPEKSVKLTRPTLGGAMAEPDEQRKLTAIATAYMFR